MRRQFRPLWPSLIALAWAVPAAADQQQEVYGPPAPAPAELRAAQVATVPAGLPETLVEAMQRAVLTHPAVSTAKANRDASRADLRGAKWLRFPSVTVEALAVTGGRDSNTRNGFEPNLVVEQPIYTAGRIGGSIDRAEADLEASESAIGETALEIAHRTVQAYFDLALAARREAILSQSLEQTHDLVETIRNRVNQEVSPRSDLDLAIARTAQIQQDLASVRGQRSAALNRLRELVGSDDFDFGNVPRLDPALSVPDASEVAARALECSPQLERLRSELEIAEADRKIARGNLFPQVIGQLSHNEVTGSRAAVVLRMQMGNGLSRLAAIDSSASRIDAAGFAIASAERAIRENVLLQFDSYRAARLRIESGRLASSTTREVTASFQRQFIAGRRTWLDVMNAVREEMNARLSEADAEILAMSTAAQIFLDTCAWQPVLEADDELDP